MNNKPLYIAGGIGVDDRGCVKFVNDFDMKKIKRFYHVSNFDKDTIRAFHGHKKEEKYVYVVKGSAIVVAVKFEDDFAPNKKNEVCRFVLSEHNQGLLYIPAGFANGFKPLENDTHIIFFSSSSLDESKGDDYRFPFDYWGAEIWEIDNR